MSAGVLNSPWDFLSRISREIIREPWKVIENLSSTRWVQMKREVHRMCHLWRGEDGKSGGVVNKENRHQHHHVTEHAEVHNTGCCCGDWNLLNGKSWCPTMHSSNDYYYYFLGWKCCSFHWLLQNSFEILLPRRIINYLIRIIHSVGLWMAPYQCWSPFLLFAVLAPGFPT